MKVTGKILNLIQDFKTQKYNLLLEINEAQVLKNQFDKLKDLDILDIDIEKHVQKRSLTSNAYCWVLLQKIAEVINSTKEEVYIQMLQSYGQFSHLIVKEKAVEKVKSQFPVVKNLGEINVGSMKAIQLQVYFGSSTFNQTEMNYFLNCIVEEAKSLDIETLPPEELKRMMEVQQ